VYKTTILPPVLYGYGTWSITILEDYRLRIFNNIVLRRILRLKMDEVMGGYKKLHNEEIHNSYSSPIIRIKNQEGVGRPCRMHGYSNIVPGA
jgi:hypothetical protein